MSIELPLVIPGRFLNALWVEPKSDGRSWEVVDHAFRYQSNCDGVGIVEVPVGFLTDFASIPKVFWNVVPPWGLYGWAAVVHDYLYTTQPVSRDVADKVLLEGMVAMGVSEGTRGIIYEAVRLAGGRSWDAHKQVLEETINEKQSLKTDRARLAVAVSYAGARVC